VYQSTPEGKILAVNPAFVKILGFDSAEEIYALSGAAALYWEPQARIGFVQELERAGANVQRESVLRRRDGAQVVVLESARVGAR